MSSNIIQFPTAVDYSGKTVAISPETPLSRFQCRGFVVFRKTPAIVPPDADQASIHVAILDGRLLELAPGTAIRTKNASLNSALELGDTDKKLYTLQTKEGFIVLTPESPEQAAQIEKELQETGQLKLSNYPNLQSKKHVVPHLSAITITDLEPENVESNSN